ncbi:MAG: glycosyltransferase family 39 protein [Candidatus Hydrogenedentes bacterium]|nr:glycosyltransferase family 39 protein [Candidatus Hydrogenedentota bacterium]
MILLWSIGIETIYGHPTPFYALYMPVFSSPLTPLAAISCACIAAIFARMAATGAAAVPRGLLAGAATGLLLFLIYYLWGPQVTGVPRATLHAAFLADFQHHLLFLALAATALTALARTVRGKDLLTWTPSPRETAWFLFATVLVAILLACATAMIRGGLEGISQAYARTTYEYIGDIGKTRSIHDLFRDYIKIHPYLSMHAKVHPPGPIAVLWIFSYAVGQDPLPLSLATIVFGALAIIPLYFWIKTLLGPAAALTACWLYTAVPAVVLFTATSADILFAPFTLATLACFERAIRRPSTRFALAAGLGYGVMILLKFSLIGIGAYFAFVGLSLLRKPETRANVFLTAFLMAAATATVLLGVYFWSGFNVIAVFHEARNQFHLDQHHLDLVTPRLPAWTYRFTNPLTWFYFAGIPVSLLFLWQLRWPDKPFRPTLYPILLTLLALNLLYLARGEGERSALYLYPFLLVPATRALFRCIEASRSLSPLWATLLFLLFQTWFTESYFYTYW